MKKKIIAVVQLFVLCLAVSSFSAVRSDGKRYDISFVNADFASVFHAISQRAGIDILLAPDVQGTLSMNVTQKTWLELLQIVCDMQDLTWISEGNYISVQRTSSYQQRVIRESEKREQSDMLAPLVRQNFQIKHASAGEMAGVLESMKSSRGRISVVERNNAIIVYDTERRLAQMRNTLRELDVETLQIVITAKLMVVDSRLMNDLGVDWSVLGIGSSRLGAGMQNRPSVAGAAIEEGVISVTPTTEITVNAFGGNMDATLASILTDSRSEILASPQISTLDHTQAEIFMGSQVSLRVMDESGNVAYQMVESGIKLTVTPHVAGDNRILLELHPENNDYGWDNNQLVIHKQEARTRVVVSDGETVIIGGLTKNEEMEVEVGIPFLKDIPVLGNLFKRTRKEVNKRDLVIFVTPRIMRNYLAAPAAISAAPVATSVSNEALADDDDYDDGWDG
jgi:type IV pilus secretin PilQ/predicted competence protein